MLQNKECLWLEVEVASNDLTPMNLDVGKLGVVDESFKIVLQPGIDQFNLHIPLMSCCPFVVK